MHSEACHCSKLVETCLGEASKEGHLPDVGCNAELSTPWVKATLAGYKMVRAIQRPGLDILVNCLEELKMSISDMADMN